MINYKNNNIGKPSHLILKNLLSLYENGLFDDAEVLAKSILQDYPNDEFSLKVLSLLFKNSHRMTDALVVNKKSISINPNDAEAFYNIANTFRSLNQSSEAIDNYKKAIAINPGYSDAYNNLGVMLKDMGMLSESVEFSKKALNYNPKNSLYYFNLGDTQAKIGKYDDARSSLMKAIAINPNFDDARFLLAALNGESITSAPISYVENLFDSFAFKFESSLVDNLEYKIPKIINDVLLKNYNNDSLGSVLDLGCGTGLVGVEIKEYCSYLVGIDVSGGMLELARQKNIYNKLIHLDIADYLKNEDLNFDTFIAADVFTYIGELSDVFRLIKSRNKLNGKVVFSTENNDNKDFMLKSSGRFSHSKKYIERLCDEFNYTLSYYTKLNLRKEKDEFIEGGFYILEF